MSSIRSQQLRINGTVAESVVDGPGLRYVIFVQGCPHHCPGCHNPQTHDFDGGFTAEAGQLLDEMAEDPLLAGATFSGGEPFCQPAVLTGIAREVHAAGRNVMTYSGWTYEQLTEKAKTDENVRTLLEETDILVDGPFLEAERDLTLVFRGSRNQRMLFLKNGKIVKEE